MGLIYCATNKVNGKKYIGQTRRSFKERYDEHMRCKFRKNSEFYRDLCEDKFEWEILEEVEDDMVWVRERYYINTLGTFKTDLGYNLNTGSDKEINGEKVVGEEEYKGYRGVDEVTEKEIKEIKTKLEEGMYQREISRTMGIKRNVIKGVEERLNKGVRDGTGYKNTYKDAQRVKEEVIKGTRNLNNISYKLNLSKDFVNGVYKGKYYEGLITEQNREDFKNTPKVDNGEESNKKSVTKQESIDIVGFIIDNYKDMTLREISSRVGISSRLVYNIVHGYSWKDVWDYYEYYYGIKREIWKRDLKIKKGKESS